MDDHGFPHVLTSTCAPWLAAALDDPYHDAAKARVDECMTSDRDDHDDVVDERRQRCLDEGGLLGGRRRG